MKNSILVKQALNQDAYRCNNFYNELYRAKRSQKSWVWEFDKDNLKKESLSFVYIERGGKVLGTQKEKICMVYMKKFYPC